MKPEPPVVTIYTDGSCSPNPGVGGWAALLVYGDRLLELGGYVPETTNNRMELTAVIEGMVALKNPCHVKIITDSSYVEGGLSLLVGSRYVSQANSDLWWKALPQLERHKLVTVERVRGHTGNPLNEHVDRLAKYCREAGKSVKRYLTTQELGWQV